MKTGETMTGEKKPPKRQYTAPALEKGLDILELLSKAGGGLMFPTIVKQLERSPSELFRMMQVLERRDLIENGEDGWALTSRLFEMGLARPPVRGLIEIALPVMRRLAMRTKQSCHLGFASRGEMVVVARMESHEQVGYSVRVGHRRPLNMSGSGTTLYAFQPDHIRREWEKLLSPELSFEQLVSFRQLAAEAVDRGFSQQPSSLTEGITDLSVPILRGGRASAALAVPFIQMKQSAMAITEVITVLTGAAGEISGELSLSDSRA
jgi:DNA-binding IclR family transcriptional regulator